MSFIDGGDAFSSYLPDTSTPTYWAVDGVSLQTFAFDIETVGGDRLAPPPLRGNDWTVPHAPGDLWIPKQVGARTMSLDMWVVGVNEDGSVPTGSNAQKFDDNFRKLRQLLWTPRRQFELTKRFYVDGELKTATALAQYSGGINPAMTGRARGGFSVDLKLADPYFYGPEINTNLLTGSQTVTVEGDDSTQAIKIHVDGPRKNLRIYNSTLDVYVEYHADLNTGDSLDIDVRAFSSVTDPATLPSYSSSSDIRHAGDAFWFLLAPGVNTIQVTSDTGIGGIVLTRQEVWL
jgi:hypothetical protein